MSSEKPLLSSEAIVTIAALVTAFFAAWGFSTQNLGIPLEGTVPLAVALPVYFATILLFVAGWHFGPRIWSRLGPSPEEPDNEDGHLPDEPEATGSGGEETFGSGPRQPGQGGDPVGDPGATPGDGQSTGDGAMPPFSDDAETSRTGGESSGNRHSGGRRTDRRPTTSARNTVPDDDRNSRGRTGEDRDEVTDNDIAWHGDRQPNE